MCVNVFYVVRNQISAESDKKWEIVCRHDVTKVGDFYNGGLWGNSLYFVRSSWNFVSDYIKIDDACHVSFSSKKQVIKKLSQKSLLQTYMKGTVVN